MTGNKKKIGIQLPRQANTEKVAIRYSLELEALDPVAEIVEVAAKTPEEFAAGVKHMDGIITSRGFRIDAPHNEETHHAINADAFAKLPDHAVVVNTARGPLIDEQALIKALDDGAIAGAGLDVLEQEPPAPDNPLLHRKNVLISPHVASATTRMRPEPRRQVGREVALVLRNRWPMSCVNPTVLSKVPLERWQPYPMNRGPNR